MKEPAITPKADLSWRNAWLCLLQIALGPVMLVLCVIPGILYGLFQGLRIWLWNMIHSSPNGGWDFPPDMP